LDSLLSTGVINSGSLVERCILGSHAHLHSYSHVSDSILMPRVEVGQGCRIHQAIIDEGVTIPSGVEIGVNTDDDARRFTISKQGIVVVPSGYAFN
jgi:glucose-1-phosphate adenylyltransferase